MKHGFDKVTDLHDCNTCLQLAQIAVCRKTAKIMFKNFPVYNNV